MVHGEANHRFWNLTANTENDNERTPHLYLHQTGLVADPRIYDRRFAPLPGSFLSAVLCNDLRGACECADDTNRSRLFE